MSTGSSKLTIRCGKEFRLAIEDACAARLKRPTVKPWTFTTFVLQAITDKLNHTERSRKTKRRWEFLEGDEGRPHRLSVIVVSAPLLNQTFHANGPTNTPADDDVTIDSDAEMMDELREHDVRNMPDFGLDKSAWSH